MSPVHRIRDRYPNAFNQNFASCLSRHDLFFRHRLQITLILQEHYLSLDIQKIVRVRRLQAVQAAQRSRATWTPAPFAAIYAKMTECSQMRKQPALESR